MARKHVGARASYNPAMTNQPPPPAGAGLAAFRNWYRQTQIPAGYTGRLHLAFTLVVGLGLIGATLAMLGKLEPMRAWDWAAVPVALLYANWAEWAGHRFVMHRPRPGLRLIYERHSLQHHRFFTESEMTIDGLKDFRAVLFPPFLVIFFLLAFFLPFTLLIQMLAGWNIALLCLASFMAYYLNYELLHLSYHLPHSHWVHRLPGFSRLMALHQHHHNPQAMAHENFNISYPVMDWIMGTWRRNKSRANP